MTVDQSLDFSAIADDLTALIASNRLVLPGVPEVASRVRQAAAEGSCDAAHLATIVSADPALSAHLIKVSNAVALRREQEIRNVRAAVTRLGFRLTAMTVTSFSILQMMAVAGSRQARVRQLYQHSVRVGELCRLLAQNHPALVPEDALLLGLVHDVGVLAILQYVRRSSALQVPDTLDELIRRLHAPIGAAMLRAWHFPAALADAVAAHEDWQRDHPGPAPDYADLLIAANFHAHRGSGHPMAALDPDTLPALRRVGPLPEMNAHAAQQIQALCGSEASA